MSVDGWGERGGSRRARLREQLVRDSRNAARQLIAVSGVQGVTVTAVAARVGVTPAALYRYFDGRRGLILSLYGDIAAELVESVRAALAGQDEGDLGGSLHAGAHAVLAWSVAHPAEFNLLMGAGFPEAAESETSGTEVVSRELGALFGPLFTELVRRELLEFEGEETIPEPLRGQLRRYRDSVDPELPLGAARAMLACWRQIYGLLCMAVNRHLSFALEDGYEALFEDMMADLLPRLGLEASRRGCGVSALFRDPEGAEAVS
ncbi:TetR/AcrR family transcriptional regulator [Streptomyces hydrogenans]|uniref:TetR/AcrR family transcriptional regulator n=1 Tax=Streptomyces hydrogenans TaxID=1873719 RepID=UPI0036B644F0